jgi:hypothetical protein
LAAGRADFLGEACDRETVTGVRALPLLVLNLVLAAAIGALHRRAAVANKIAVLILICIRDQIKDTSWR